MDEGTDWRNPLVSAHLYIEGSQTGPDSKEQQIRCREGFRKLFEKCDLDGRMPRLSACGSRNNAFKDFKTAHARRKAAEYIGLLIDSEDPVADTEETWAHLKQRDGWEIPAGAADDQVLLMTTCTETWIVADRSALVAYFDQDFRPNNLPALTDMERRDRHEVQDALIRASRDCKSAYKKGNRTFDLVGLLRPNELERHLPSFVRIVSILKEKL